MDRASRVKGAVLGHAVGDALGVPVEGLSRDRLRQDPVRDMRGGGSHGLPPGFWSDDTTLMLALLDTMTPEPDLDQTARHFIAWLEEGRFTPGGFAFGIGRTTYQATLRLAAGVEPTRAGGRGEWSNGNGSLMRILPMSLLGRLDEPALLAMTHRASRLTHAHPRSQMACGLFVLLARRILDGVEPVRAYQEAARAGQRHYDAPPFRDELAHHARFLSGELPGLAESEIASGVYVVETLEAAVWCLLNSGSFEEAVLRAVNLGGDTDTTGAVTGGLAGACFGFSAIPDQWLRVLAKADR
ncbi:MAG: ADP-ribosylglycohydrolase family protein, partial [Proteobacteria bacterium]|nr:ADP-ribosylglycohydrolase family protein [Pseudomonadota bacterium]